MTANSTFAQWASAYSGCDGGDIGSPASHSIWLCGIEWGGAGNAENLKADMLRGASQPRAGYEHASDNLAYIFNRQALKILCAISGGQVSDYQEFCEQVQPFTKGSSGYFKMNLYPIAFKDTNQAHWNEQFAELTGLEKKSDYTDWCKQQRFPQIRQWARAARPRLILCLGKSYRTDFKRAFHDENATFNHKPIDGRDLWWSLNADGSLVVIIPFMVNRHGLTRNESIQRFGEKIAQLMQQHGCQ